MGSAPMKLINQSCIRSRLVSSTSRRIPGQVQALFTLSTSCSVQVKNCTVLLTGISKVMLDFLLHSSQCEEASQRTCVVWSFLLIITVCSKGKTLTEVKRSQNIIPVSDGHSSSIRGDSHGAVKILQPVSSSHHTKVNSNSWDWRMESQFNVCGLVWQHKHTG